MPFIRRSHIDPLIRTPFERKYVSRLREALRNPGLTPEQREAIQKKIRAVTAKKDH